MMNGSTPQAPSKSTSDLEFSHPPFHNPHHSHTCLGGQEDGKVEYALDATADRSSRLDSERRETCMPVLHLTGSPKLPTP
jgi:hypothetical protein